MIERTYFREAQSRFSLTRTGDVPVRNAQLGALHAIGAHFAVHAEPAIVALPTGVGKTVVGAAAPFVLSDVNRVLYIVPTKVLRQDAVRNLSSQIQLRNVSLIGDDVGNPIVIDISSKPSGWSDFEECDAAVGLPNSLFELIESSPPHRDLFDLVVFDEAHHVPARTWELVSGAFDARQVLLTATPYRRDSRELPGTVAFNYPLSRAIADKAYAPIDLVGVESFGMTDDDRDAAIAEKAVAVLRGGDHSATNSRLLVRAATKERAEKLSRLYEDLGVSVHVVHSSLTPATVEKRIAEVRNGGVEGIAFVGVLGEGFDCPELKVGAYHDKHRSLPVTLQFLGRLSRVCADAGPPQVVSAVETLRDDTWGLWRRDSDWSRIVPEIAESATDDVSRRKRVLGEMEDFPRDEVSLADIVLRPSFGMYEVTAQHELAADDPGGETVDFGLDVEGVEGTGLLTGGRFAGGAIMWSHLSEAEQFLMFVTSHVERPDWLRSRALDTERFEIHAVLVRKDVGGLPVIAVSSTTRKREAEIMELLTGAPDGYRLASPDLMRRFLSVAAVGSIQHLGTRNSAPGSQARTYTTNTGRAVEDGIAYEDMRDDVIGHVGAQCHIDGSDYNGGVSITNSRLWVIKRFPIEGYIDFVSGVLKQMGAGQPGEIRRLTARFEEVLQSWPSAEPVAAVLDHYFLTEVGKIGEQSPVDLDLRPTPPENGLLGLELPAIRWSAAVRPNGTFGVEGNQVDVETSSGTRSLGDLLVEYPPTVYYRDGASSRGQRLVPAGSSFANPPIRDIVAAPWDWTSTNIQSETPRVGRSDSIHEKVEAELLGRDEPAWLIGDDGSGEIADHILIEPFDGEQLHLHLYHSKASLRPSPGLRTRDLDELVAQIVRSRRWVGLADGEFWQRLAHRAQNRASTKLISSPETSSVGAFAQACLEWADSRPIVTVHYVGIQPGLDANRLLAEYETDPTKNPRILETIGACGAWVGGPSSTLTLIGS